MITRIVNAKDGLDEAVSLITNAYDAAAVKKIFEAKGRPQDNPLIVHISGTEEVRDIAREVPDVFYTLAEKFMPGALTVVLPKSARVPDIVTAGGDTVAVRMPDNAVARELIARSFPIAAPSANRSKHVSPTSAKHVYDDLNGRVPLILDGGECAVGIESTVLDLTSGSPVILRPGAVTAEMLAPYLGVTPGSGKVIGTAKSPGMKYEHYAPAAEAYAARSAASAAKIPCCFSATYMPTRWGTERAYPSAAASTTSCTGYIPHCAQPKRSTASSLSRCLTATDARLQS